jgi:hypothetical protein
MIEAIAASETQAPWVALLDAVIAEGFTVEREGPLGTTPLIVTADEDSDRYLLIEAGPDGFILAQHNDDGPGRVTAEPTLAAALAALPAALAALT